MLYSLLPPEEQTKVLVWVSRHFYSVDHWVRTQLRDKLVNQQVKRSKLVEPLVSKNKSNVTASPYLVSKQSFVTRWVLFLGPEAAQYALLFSPVKLSVSLQRRLLKDPVNTEILLANRRDLSPKVVLGMVKKYPLKKMVVTSLTANPSVSDEMKAYLSFTYPEEN